MAKESKDGKTKAPKEPQAETPSETLAENGSSPTKARTAIDDVIAAIEAARDKVMADEVKALTKLGIPRAMAYQMVAARFHQNVVTDGDSGTPEFENSHWNDR
jgi:phage-related tail fiber protein